MKIFDITLPLSNQTLIWEGDKGITIDQIAFIKKYSDFKIFVRRIRNLSWGSH